MRDLASLFRGGLRNFLSRVAHRVLEPLVAWETFWFFERDLTATAMPEPLSADGPLKVHLATLEEMRILLAHRPGEAERREAAGDLCFVGVYEGRVVHQTWLGTRATYIPEIGARIKLGPGESYLYRSITHEEARGKGVQPGTARVIVRYQKEHGIVRHFLFVKAQNFPALQVLRRLSPAPKRIRVLRRVRFLRGRRFLVLGLSGSDPLFELEGLLERALGGLGFWLPEDAR